MVFLSFNILFLLGYNPETSYEKLHRETWVTPDEQYIDSLMEHMLPSEEYTQENANKIMQWIQSHLNKDGQIKEILIPLMEEFSGMFETKQYALTIELL